MPSGESLFCCPCAVRGGVGIQNHYYVLASHLLAQEAEKWTDLIKVTEPLDPQVCWPPVPCFDSVLFQRILVSLEFVFFSPLVVAEFC